MVVRTDIPDRATYLSIDSGTVGGSLEQHQCCSLEDIQGMRAQSAVPDKDRTVDAVDYKPY